MTVTLHSRNNDINNRVSPQLEDDSRNQDRFESQMTNKFGALTVTEEEEYEAVAGSALAGQGQGMGMTNIL